MFITRCMSKITIQHYQYSVNVNAIYFDATVRSHGLEMHACRSLLIFTLSSFCWNDSTAYYIVIFPILVIADAINVS